MNTNSTPATVHACPVCKLNTVTVGICLRCRKHASHATTSVKVIYPTTTAADFAAAYVAAREASRIEGATLTQREAAWSKAELIESLAAKAGVVLDTITLDEQARQNTHPVVIN